MELPDGLTIFIPTVKLIFVNVNFPCLKDCHMPSFRQIEIPPYFVQNLFPSLSSAYVDITISELWGAV